VEIKVRPWRAAVCVSQEVSATSVTEQMHGFSAPTAVPFKGTEADSLFSDSHLGGPGSSQLAIL